MKRIHWLSLFVLLLQAACSSKTVKQMPVIPMGKFFPYTLVYQSGRQASFLPGTSQTAPFGGLAREANALESIRSNSTDVIYVDAGNLFLPEKPTEDMEKYRSQSPMIVEALNLMSLDVFSPGPTDWKLGRETILKLSKDAAFKFVATNVMDDKDRRILPAFQLVQRGGLTFAFLSIVPEGWYGSDIHATSPKQALNKWVWQASVRADVVIVLSQLGDVQEDKKILEKYPQVRIVIGNDPRRTLENPEWVNGRVLLDGYRHGYFLGKFTFEMRPPFFGFYSEPLLEKTKAQHKQLERDLASETEVERRAAIQGSIAELKKGHPTSRISGASRFIHELIPLDAERFGRMNEISALLTPGSAAAPPLPHLPVTSEHEIDDEL